MMKRFILLFSALLFTLGSTATAQSNQPQNDKKKRIVIVKKSIDESGETVIEKIIGEGAQADRVLKEVVFREDEQDVSITVIKDLKSGDSDAKKERLFMFRSAGGEKLEGLIDTELENIEWQSEDGIHLSTPEDYKGYKNVTVIRKAGTGEEEIKTRILINHDGGNNADFNWHGGEATVPVDANANCAALGVYVSQTGNDQAGVRVSSLIRGGGAEESGLRSGDRLIAINDSYVHSYNDLLRALSGYVPGEDVNVTFTREGQEANMVVTLKAWGEMPTMANTWRARITCDEKVDLLENEKIPEVKSLNANPNIPTFTSQPLALERFHVFPNPSEGKFRLQFNAKAAPLTVRVTDLLGREVYRDQLNRFDGIYNEQINLRKYGAGSYILTIIQNDRVYAEQIVVQ